MKRWKAAIRSIRERLINERQAHKEPAFYHYLNCVIVKAVVNYNDNVIAKVITEVIVEIIIEVIIEVIPKVVAEIIV